MTAAYCPSHERIDEIATLHAAARVLAWLTTGVYERRNGFDRTGNDLARDLLLLVETRDHGISCKQWAADLASANPSAYVDRSATRPTEFLPGTNGRIAVYQARVARGEDLHHPQDASLDDDRAGLLGCSIGRELRADRAAVLGCDGAQALEGPEHRVDVYDQGRLVDSPRFRDGRGRASRTPREPRVYTSHWN